MPVPGPIPYPVSGETILTSWGSAVADAVNARTPQVVRGPASSQALTAAEADLAGLTLTVGPGTFVIEGIFSMDISAVNPGTLSGRLSIDGVTQAGEAQFLTSSTVTGRSTIQMTWPVVIAGPGVLKLRVMKGLAGGTAQAVAGQCALVVL